MYFMFGKYDKLILYYLSIFELEGLSSVASGLLFQVRLLVGKHVSPLQKLPSCAAGGGVVGEGGFSAKSHSMSPFD